MASPASPPSYLKLFLTQLYRHRLIIIIPPIFFYSIYADYNHTQRWKQSKLENNN